MFSLKLQSEGRSSARALRAIGQDLAALFPERLEIDVKDGIFIARGLRKAEAAQGDATTQASTLKKIWKQLAHQDLKAEGGQPEPVPFERAYSPIDIDRLDQIGAVRRNSAKGLPDIYSLGERLRTIGRIVDSCGGKLIKLSHDINSVRFEYEDDEGKNHSKEFSTLALYKIQQDYYSGRVSPELTDLWKGLDR